MTVLKIYFRLSLEYYDIKKKVGAGFAKTKKPEEIEGFKRVKGFEKAKTSFSKLEDGVKRLSTLSKLL